MEQRQIKADNSIVKACQSPGYKQKIEGAGFRGKVLLDVINSRLKVLNFQGEDMPSFIREITNLAKAKDLSKIIFYVKENYKQILNDYGFKLEGTIPFFFNGDDCFSFSYFVDSKRGESPYLEKEDVIIQEILDSKSEIIKTQLPLGLTIKTAGKEDAEKLVKLYRDIFSTYPSPLLNVVYVKSVIDDTVHFMAVFDGDKIVSAASAEMDKENKNAEITDCATLSKYRGKGLLTNIIVALEKEMWYRNFTCLYSLARAGSCGMNAVLHKLGYSNTGRMINNCHIGGRFEDMNIWAKHCSGPIS